MVDIVPVEGAAHLNAFIDLPFRLYGEDPQWVPNIRRDMKRQLDPRVNPFFDHAEAQCFLAQTGGKVVGRIAAIHNGFDATLPGKIETTVAGLIAD